MSQVMDHDTETDTVPENWTADEEQAPRRPKRKKLTPVTGSLVAIILAAGGFAGGVSVQKNRGTTTAATGFPGGGTGAAGGFTGGPPGATGTGGGTGTSDATVGTVTYAKGDVIYVKDSSGNTVKVKIKSTADVTRTATTDSGKIQPGDSVTVTGAAATDGTVTATDVTAQAASN